MPQTVSFCYAWLAGPRDRFHPSTLSVCIIIRFSRRRRRRRATTSAENRADRSPPSSETPSFHSFSLPSTPVRPFLPDDIYKNKMKCIEKKGDKRRNQSSGIDWKPSFYTPIYREREREELYVSPGY